MAGDENLAASLGGDGIDARLLGGGQDLQLAAALHVLPGDGGMAGVGDHEHVVEAPQEHGRAALDHMGEDAEELLVQRNLGDAIVVVQPRLGAPADVEGAVDVGAAPLHDLAELVPVFHLFKSQVLHRRACDNETVEIPIAHLVEGGIELQHVLLGGVLRLMGGGLHQLQLHLQGGVAQKAGKLGLGGDLRGHEVQHQDLQRTDVLGHGAGFGHDEDVFIRQGLRRGEFIRNSDRHVGSLL